jgi:hypothetical protein
VSEVEPLRILVTGWRFWPVEYVGIVWNALDAVSAGVLPSAAVLKAGDARTAQPARRDWLNGPVIVRHGQCPFGGVDLHAEQWAIERGHRVERYPADFAMNGPGAGPRRNEFMASQQPAADICLAFPGPVSRGTIDCATRAWKAGIETVITAFVEPFDMRQLNRDPIDWPPLTP